MAKRRKLRDLIGPHGSRHIKEAEERRRKAKALEGKSPNPEEVIHPGGEEELEALLERRRRRFGPEREI